MIDVVVLISGRGSNLRALVEAQTRAHYRVVGVISSRADAAGLTWARAQRLPATALTRAEHPAARAYDEALDALLQRYSPGLVVLAGFMRILTPPLVARWEGRMINIHPSLLPGYPGLDTHARVLAAGDAETGASVHYVTADLDAGPVIARSRVPVAPGDCADSLAARVLDVEHRLLPWTTELIATGRIEWRKGTVLLDDQPLQSPLDFRP